MLQSELEFEMSSEVQWLLPHDGLEVDVEIRSYEYEMEDGSLHVP